MSSTQSRKEKPVRAIDGLLERLKELEQTSGEPFPPNIDDVISEDLHLTRWRVEAPPRQVAEVRRCYGEAHATLLYAQSDAIVEGQPLDEAARRRTFLRSFMNRIRRVKG